MSRTAARTPRFLTSTYYRSYVRTAGKDSIAFWIIANWRRTKRNADSFSIETIDGEPAVIVYLRPGKRLAHEPARLADVRIVYRNLQPVRHTQS
jgi:hypothetical protein